MATAPIFAAPKTSALNRYFQISLYLLLLVSVLTLVCTGKLDVVSILLPPAAWDPLESTCRHASLSIL